MKKLFIILFVASLSFLGKNEVFSVQMESSPEHIYKILPNELQWKSNPALPKEIQVAIIYGDPNKNGPLVMRLKVPAGSKIAPHWHPISENVTVLSGSLNVGSGDKPDLTDGIHIPAGSFISIPEKHHHYAWFTEDTVLQFNNFGHWQINYVNPKDDPRNQ
jgi:quercetin dioxygenase-like cupin family protein